MYIKEIFMLKKLKSRFIETKIYGIKLFNINYKINLILIRMKSLFQIKV